MIRTGQDGVVSTETITVQVIGSICKPDATPKTVTSADNCTASLTAEQSYYETCSGGTVPKLMQVSPLTSFVTLSAPPQYQVTFAPTKVSEVPLPDRMYSLQLTWYPNSSTKKIVGKEIEIDGSCFGCGTVLTWQSMVITDISI